MNEPNPVQRRSCQGVLCIAFPNDNRLSGAADRLDRLRNWVVEAGSDADIELSAVEGEFDDKEDIVSRIYRRIQDADIVVSVVFENNPNVFFESGYAIGLGKPILYIVREGEKVPFDIAGVENFKFRELDEETKNGLVIAMRNCVQAGKMALVAEPDLARMRRHLFLREFIGNLYAECIQHTFKGLSDWVCSWRSNSFEFLGAHNILEIGTHILRKLNDGGFATQYYSGQESWEPEDIRTTDEYFEATRSSVRDGRKIARVYVVNDSKQINEQAFRETVWADAAAGIDVKHILKSKLPDPASTDFGLWDDELFGQVEYVTAAGKPPRLHRCRYFSDDFHLNQARQWKRRIEQGAKPCFDLPSEDMLLKKSAFVLHNECHAYCSSSDHGKKDCSAYHLPWQRLRLCGVVSTPSWHGEFYANAFRSWCDSMKQKKPHGRLNILVSGLADYAMLYWVAQSIEHAERKRCTFHVLDICQTPLKACLWLTRRLFDQCNPPLSLDVLLYHRDIYKNGFDPDSFDLITSDAFLTRFEGVQAKVELFNEWIRVLRPGGRIITTARVKERADDIKQSDRQAFIERAVSFGLEKGIPEHEVRSLAQAYASYIDSYPFVTETEARRFIEQYTSQVEILDLKFRLLPEEKEMVPANYCRMEIERKL